MSCCFRDGRPSFLDRNLPNIRLFFASSLDDTSDTLLVPWDNVLLCFFVTIGDGLSAFITGTSSSSSSSSDSSDCHDDDRDSDFLAATKTSCNARVVVLNISTGLRELTTRKAWKEANGARHQYAPPIFARSVASTNVPCECHPR